MADRQRQAVNGHGHAHGNPAPINNISQPRNGSSATLSNARRNLFQAQRARRPAQPAPQHPTGDQTAHADQELGSSVGDYSDLVVREANGEFSVDDPPVIELDEEDMVEGVNDGESELN